MDINLFRKALSKIEATLGMGSDEMPFAVVSTKAERDNVVNVLGLAGIMTKTIPMCGSFIVQTT